MRRRQEGASGPGARCQCMLAHVAWREPRVPVVLGSTRMPFALPVPAPPPLSPLCLAPALLVGAAGFSYYSGFARRDPILSATPKAEFTNWSGTHSVVAHRLYEPESLKDLENIVHLAHKGGPWGWREGCARWHTCSGDSDL